MLNVDVSYAYPPRSFVESIMIWLRVTKLYFVSLKWKLVILFTFNTNISTRDDPCKLYIHHNRLYVLILVHLTVSGIHFLVLILVSFNYWLILVHLVFVFRIFLLVYDVCFACIEGSYKNSSCCLSVLPNYIRVYIPLLYLLLGK